MFFSTGVYFSIMTIGKSIRLLREALKIKQNDFAEKCDIEAGTLCAIEKRESARTKFAKQIANKGFGISTDLLETIKNETDAESIARAIESGAIPKPDDSLSVTSLLVKERACIPYGNAESSNVIAMTPTGNIKTLIELAQKMSPAGQERLIGYATSLVDQFPVEVKPVKSSSSQN